MSVGEDEERFGGRPSKGGRVAATGSSASEICFDQREIKAILDVYGRKVAAGEWRDYAIDHRRGEAVFSIFRRSSECPLYRIVKRPHTARRLGAYSVLAAGGLILGHSHNLRQVLFTLDGSLRLIKA